MVVLESVKRVVSVECGGCGRYGKVVGSDVRGMWLVWWECRVVWVTCVGHVRCDAHGVRWVRWVWWV